MNTPLLADAASEGGGIADEESQSLLASASTLPLQQDLTVSTSKPLQEGGDDPTTRDLVRATLSAAWPQATVVACRTLVDLTTTAVLGLLGTDELAAAAFALVVINITAIVLWQGFGDAVIALSSQAIGAGNPKLAGIRLQTSLFCIALGSLPIGVSWWFTGDLIALAGVSERVRELAGTFGRYSLVWLLPDACFGAFFQWLNAQQLVRPTIVINVFFVAWNLGANIVLVHGLGSYWGGLGFRGSPLATASTKILRGLVVVWWVCYVKQLHVPCWHPWTRDALRPSRLGVFLKQAIPGGVAGLLEQAQFVCITLFIGALGEQQLAAHSGMLDVFSFFTCGMFALTDAGSSAVGRYLGAGRPSVARRMAGVLFLCMVVLAVFVGAIFIGAHSVIGKMFSEDPGVWRWTSDISTIIGLAYVLLAITFASFGVLGGQGRPHVAAASMFVGLWGVSVPLAYAFSRKPILDYLFGKGEGLIGVWWGLIVGYGMMTLVMVTYVARSDWPTLAKQAQERSEVA